MSTPRRMARFEFPPDFVFKIGDPVGEAWKLWCERMLGHQCIARPAWFEIDDKARTITYPGFHGHQIGPRCRDLLDETFHWPEDCPDGRALDGLRLESVVGRCVIPIVVQLESPALPLPPIAELV